MAAVVQQIAGQVEDQQRAGRVDRWERWLESAWISKPSKVYAWCKGVNKSAVTMISRPDGTLTGNLEEMDALLQNAWAPIMRMYERCPEPAWDPFFERFGKYIESHPMPVNNLTGERLKQTLRRMRRDQACGCEG